MNRCRHLRLNKLTVPLDGIIYPPDATDSVPEGKIWGGTAMEEPLHSSTVAANLQPSANHGE